jgi:hypothetical protein
LVTNLPARKAESHSIEAKIMFSEYDEHSESYNKITKSFPLIRKSKKLSKKEFLENKQQTPKKLAFVPKRSKIVQLKARVTKLWHQGEYARTNPPSHDNDCVCLSCIIYRDEAETMIYMQDLEVLFNSFVEYDE